MFVMFDEAIKSLRTLFLASLGFLFLWLLYWPTAVEKLNQYRDARHLHAWLFLKEKIHALPIDQLLDEPIENAMDIGEECIEVVDWMGGGPPECHPLRLDISWPLVDSIPLNLHLRYAYPPNKGNIPQRSNIRVYSVKTPDMVLPFREYNVVFLGTGEGVVVPAYPKEKLTDLGGDSLKTLSFEIKKHLKPLNWNSISLQLGSQGFHGLPFQLNPETPVVKRYQMESDPRALKVQVFGAQISIGLFFASIGCILSVVAFAMLGPLLRLRETPEGTTNQPWVMVVSTVGSLTGNVLEGIIVVVSLTWVALPIVILVLQSSANVELLGFEKAAKTGGNVGLLFSSSVYGLVAWKFRGFRRTRSQ